MSDKPRGFCPVCKRDIELLKNGNLRHHGGPKGSGMWDEYRLYRCPGAGSPPATAEEPTR